MREVSFKAPAALQLRLERLLDGGLTDFNARISNAGGLLDDSCGNSFNKVADKILDNYRVLRLIVYYYLAS